MEANAFNPSTQGLCKLQIRQDYIVRPCLKKKGRTKERKEKEVAGLAANVSITQALLKTETKESQRLIGYLSSLLVSSEFSEELHLKGIMQRGI